MERNSPTPSNGGGTIKIGASRSAFKPYPKKAHATSLPPPPAPATHSLDPMLLRLAKAQAGIAAASNNSSEPNDKQAGAGCIDAIHWASRRLEERRKELGDSHPDIAQLHIELGDILLKMGKANGDALPHFKEALCILAAANGERHVSTAPVYRRLASIFKEQGRQYDALKHYKEVLRILRRSAGQDNEEVADAICNIGVIYMNQVPGATSAYPTRASICRREGNREGRKHKRYNRPHDPRPAAGPRPRRLA
mmetsp:Transcript_22234/g.51681  ORF Transcript_22234/g.51681 Transcript_22234/m.51681 type:complete len:252 (+) Transcript_22234:111-866(+)